jgi:hypothetical protein
MGRKYWRTYLSQYGTKTNDAKIQVLCDTLSLVPLLPQAKLCRNQKHQYKFTKSGYSHKRIDNHHDSRDPKVAVWMVNSDNNKLLQLSLKRECEDTICSNHLG